MKKHKVNFILTVATACALFALTATPQLAYAKDKKAVEKVENKKAAKKASTKKSGKIARKALFSKYQTALNKNGAKLTVDGIWGKKSRAALIAFQKNNKLKATGRLDKKTKSKLGV